MTRGTKGVAVAVAFGATVMLGACSTKRDANTTDTTAMAAAPGTDSTMNAAGSMNAAAGSSTSMNNGGAMAGNMGNMAMTDADIFSMVSAVNKGEIAAGKMAETKATNPAVRAFAKDMVTDHTMLLNQGMALAKRLNVTPSPTADSSIVMMNNTMASQLSSAAKGMAFDSMYVNDQVQGHQAALDLVNNAEGKAQNADLKAMLTKAQPIIQRHLDRIKDIQGKMK